MALGVTSSGPSGHGHWPGAGQLALAGGQYYCPVPAETLVQAPGSAQAADQLVYAATAGHQPASYQTVDLSDSGHHLVPAGQNSEVIFTRLHSLLIETVVIIYPRQCLWCCHHGRAIARVHPVHLMNVERRQAAVDPRPSQTT